MTRSSFLRLSLFAVVVFSLTASTASAVGPLQFYSLIPCRLVDTREPQNPQGNGGPILQHGLVRSFAVYGSNSRICGVPADGTVKAVTINVTVVNPSSGGHLTAFPFNTSVPLVSTINYAAGEPALANGAIVPLTNDASFQVSVLPVLGGGTGSTVHLILDITGYFK
ncbi:MAG TPA: hypothetical protein VGQ75_01140 [Thermoanaerobaculia bacterium]|jgi:hypothetical protein|nr:hypothetical protein [Thermoanaerobaculia bacterium]